MNREEKPRLLLHACCGPCSVLVWQNLLSEYKTVLPFFYNPNIEPSEEYGKRLEAMRQLGQGLGLPILEDHSGRDEWRSITEPWRAEPEGGHRCRICMEFRLKKTFAQAVSQGFEVVATTLSVSRYKNSNLILELGRSLSAEFGVAFLMRDFKKKNGSALSHAMAKKWGLYQQRYCGCLRSKKEQD